VGINLKNPIEKYVLSLPHVQAVVQPAIVKHTNSM